MDNARKQRPLEALVTAARRDHRQQEKDSPVLGEIRELEAEIYRTEIFMQCRVEQLKKIPTSTDEWEAAFESLAYAKEMLDTLRNYQDKLLLEYHCAEPPAEEGEKEA